ncbi:MAG TPA: hypothetical protein VE779_01120, partial [Candidatus Angelobacter sp.]|nr:hypothetical protein [Candidatus Angelobacter sp.]
MAERIPAALSFRSAISPELIPCGLAEVDAMLGGGLPLGAITELTGSHSSGRTTLALAVLAEVTRRGDSCAYVDASDALNPLSASALGVDLRHLLWVRGGEADVAAAGSPFPSTTRAQPRIHEKFGLGPRWCRPRDEASGTDLFIDGLFQEKHAERADFTPRCSEVVRRERAPTVAFAPQAVVPGPSSQRTRNARGETSWTNLDHALRATDLLLNTGGFRALVLDIGNVSPKQARHVPLATWYRFRLQVEKTRTLFLLMTRVPCANSCAAVSLHCQQTSTHWQHAAENSPPLLAGLRYSVHVTRSRAVNGPT